jgi:hypothetical protein
MASDLRFWVELMQRYSKLADLSKIGHSTTVRSVPIARRRIHSARKRLGPEAVAQLVADYQAGVPATQLMGTYGIGKGAVLRILHEAGVIRSRPSLTSARLQEAAELYGQGWSLVRLGEHFGFDQSAIWLGLKRMKVPMRRPWERSL